MNRSKGGASMASKSSGTCTSCHQSFAKSGITRHLASCEQRKIHLNDLPLGKSKTRETSLFHLAIEGRPNPEYWLHIEIPADASLKRLDTFLRGIWLECCGHLSAFRIDRQAYTVMPEPEYGDKGMNGKIRDLLPVGTKADYEYDFGTTSELVIRSLEERPSAYRGYDISILARNDAPRYPCDICAQASVFVCSQCIYEGNGMLCETHSKEHKCGEEMLLPVVNSPRVGMCGYTG
jgi:hypothetical protein